MQDPGKIIYPLAALIFGAAVVFLLWGEQLGVARLARSIPGPVLLVITLVALVLVWRFGSGQPFGRKTSWRVALLGAALVALLLYLIYWFSR